ncbi:MAG: DEAD/DEAH box helicase [Chitinophagaceae bacterium]|jgi:ATP-dependent RNA helicase DeaD
MQIVNQVLQHLPKIGIKELNKMQQDVLNLAPKHKELMLLSPTGSGKTLAYVLGALTQIDLEKKGTQLLIVTPSRELAQQTEKVFKQLNTGLKITACYGGHKREIEENNLIETPTVIVGTAGRLADHLRRESIKPDTITTLVLDEFDKTFEQGFTDEVGFIIQSLINKQNDILVSATKPIETPSFITLDGFFTLNFLPTIPVINEKLAIKKLVSNGDDKIEDLFKLLCSIGNRSSIVFCNHRDAVERISKHLKQNGIVNEFYHGAMEQHQRDSALCKFINGTVEVLVTTDLASRGLDITNVRNIIHYQIPATKESYTHRNGRTARMHYSGTVIMILGKEEYMPPYVEEEVEDLVLEGTYEIPQKPTWSTLFIAAGKKNKVNKIDVVGFLMQKALLKKEDIGLIDVKDFASFVAIRKNKMSSALELIKDQKIKGLRVRMEIAK